MARRPGRFLTLLGVLTLIAGVIGAVVLVASASQRRANAVDGFARAPVGCDTTLDFAEPGEYLVFVERAGSITSVGGDCDVDADYDVEGDIGVVVTLVDPAGTDIELNRVIGSIDYDVDGFVGESQFTVDIAESGDHVVRVESDDGAFAVAVGRDPADGLSTLYVAAVVAAAAGVIVGMGMILAGRGRRKQAVPAAPVGPWGTPFSPVGQVPQGPPTYTQPGGPVDYGRPTVPAPGSVPPMPGAPWQPAAPVTAPPPGMPQYEPPARPPAPPPPPAPRTSAPADVAPPDAPGRSVPQIPGEPSWIAPGEQPAAPIAVPIPPDTGARADLSADSPFARPAVTDRRSPLDDGDSSGDRAEPPRRDQPPPPD